MLSRSSSRPDVYHTLRSIGLLVLLSSVACSPQASPSPRNEEFKSSQAGTLHEATQNRPLRETWESHYIQGSKVGYGHTKKRWFAEDGRQLVEWVSKTELTLTRFGQTITQSMTLFSVESPEGELIRFRATLKQGPTPIELEGHVENDRLLITTRSQGAQESMELAWDSAWRSLFATEQTLEWETMHPGESRRFKSLVPVINQVAVMTLEAMDFERTELLTGTHELLKIRSTAELEKSKIESFLWVNRTGQILKSYLPAIGQTSYRTSKTMALDQPDAMTFDLGHFSTVRVNRLLSKPHDTKQVVYRVRLNNNDPSSVFVSGLSQSIESIDVHEARIVVRAVRPNVPQEVDRALIRPPSADDLNANHLIQSEDERVVRMADASVPAGADPWEVACSLESVVQQRVVVKGFSQAFATAAEVAEHLEGDCTEHSVLLAALCRARGIPARVAMGLVYFPKESGFAYHMWNEVWIEDRWVPMDATLARSGIGAAHLKLADSNLKGTMAYAAFLPVFQVLGQLAIQIEGVQ